MSQQNQSSRAFLFLVVALVVLLIVVVVGFGLYFLYKLDESSKQNEKIEKIDSQLQTLQEEQEENSDYEIKRNSQSKNDKKAQPVQTPVESKVNTSLLVVAYVKDEDGYTNVRSGKGTQYSIIGKYKDGASVLVHPDDFSKSWMRVYHDNGVFYGYMSRNKIVNQNAPTTPTLVYAYVKDEDGYTNVRSGKGTNYPIVGKVSDGNAILVNADDFSKSWMRVYHDNGTFYGYMSRNKIVR